MRLNIDRDLVKQLVSGQLPNNSRHLDELTHEPPIWQCDTGQWLSCFDSCQLTISWMANVTGCGFAKTRLRHPSLPLIVSPTLPVQSVDAYVRTYIRTYLRSVSHVTTKRKEVDHIPWVWGSVPRALRTRGSPAIITLFKSRSQHQFWGSPKKREFDRVPKPTPQKLWKKGERDKLYWNINTNEMSILRKKTHRTLDVFYLHMMDCFQLR